MKILHFTHPRKSEYIVLSCDPATFPADHAKPGYTLYSEVEYGEPESGNENSLPMESNLINEDN